MKRTSGQQEKLTGERLARAIDRYKAGDTLLELSAAFGVGRTSIARSLRKAGVALRLKGRATAAQSKARGKAVPMQGFNRFSNEWAKKPLMVSA